VPQVDAKLSTRLRAGSGAHMAAVTPMTHQYHSKVDFKILEEASAPPQKPSQDRNMYNLNNMYEDVSE